MLDRLLGRLRTPSDLHDRGAGLGASATVCRGAGVDGGRALSTHYWIEARGPDGRLKWVEEFTNLVVNAGLNDSLDKHLKGSSYTAAWYVGITAGTPTFAAADTMSSHAGWTEVTAYTQANRPTLTLGTVASQSVDNSASKATFSINANGTVIGGAFVVSNNTKGGTTGTLYGGGAFAAGNKTLDNGDTLDVTVTLTASAS
jgi:hypothetical protein